MGYSARERVVRFLEPSLPRESRYGFNNKHIHIHKHKGHLHYQGQTLEFLLRTKTYVQSTTFSEFLNHLMSLVHSTDINKNARIHLTVLF